MAQDKMLKFLVEGLTRAFDKQEDCDVMFSVDGQTIGAHRLILNIHSQVLYEMAAGWTPDKDPIAIDDMSFDSFKALLRFMYGCEPVSSDTIFIFLSASTHFKMNFLEELCVDHITESMGVENVCIYMTEAVNFNSTVLQEKCCEMFSQQTAHISMHKSFRELSQPALLALLNVEQTNVLEILLFRCIKLWMEQQCRDEGLPVNGTNMRHVIGDALYKIRFPTMTVQDFANSVATIKGLLTNTEIAQIFQKITVFENEDVECPFSSIFRCQFYNYYIGYRDIETLCGEKVLYQKGCEEKMDFDSVLKHVKDLPNGKDMLVPSFRLLLQCCADIANSSGVTYYASPQNRAARNDLCDEFRAWQDTFKNKNISEIMTKYTELRKKENELYKWLF